VHFLLQLPDLWQSHATHSVCLSSHATKATKCSVLDVEEQIKKATTKHATGNQITKEACVVSCLVSCFGAFLC